MECERLFPKYHQRRLVVMSRMASLVALLRRRRTKCVVGTYVKSIPSYISQHISQVLLARRRMHVMLDRYHFSRFCSLSFSFGSGSKGIPHFRMINHDDVARWRRVRRRSECTVQCTGREVLLDHECFTTITPGRCWVCCCV